MKSIVSQDVNLTSTKEMMEFVTIERAVRALLSFFNSIQFSIFNFTILDG
jgi:acetyl-CoA acyltransferase